MKKLLFSILILVPFFAFSQKFYQVSYSWSINNQDGERSMIYNSDASVFFTPKKDSMDLGEKVVVGMKETNLNFNLDFERVKYVNRTNDSLIYTEYDFLKKMPYKAAGKIPDIKWAISNEKKVIQGYTCQKATTTYKCRDYMVWYTKEIPIPHGPWELGGLPGLILEVNDSENYLVAKARSIKRVNASQFYKKLNALEEVPRSMPIEKSEWLQETMPEKFIKKITHEVMEGLETKLDTIKGTMTMSSKVKSYRLKNCHNKTQNYEQTKRFD